MDIKRHVQELEKKRNKKRAEYVKNTLFLAGVPYQTQKFKIFLRSGENIIVDYPFFQKSISGTKKIFITAHYDTFLWSPGANDNASGVSVLLEFIAKLAKAPPEEKLIRFIFFDLEDMPPFRSGSEYYAKNSGVCDVEQLYNLEMVGIGNLLMLWADKKDLIWLNPLIDAARKQGMPVFVVPSVLEFSSVFKFVKLQSDHVSFIKAGARKVCALTVESKEDVKFQRIIEAKMFSYLLFSALKYVFTKKGDFPKTLRHYHCSSDRSEFVEENALEKILNILWETVFHKNPE